MTLCTTLGRCGATNGVMRLADAEHLPRNVNEAAAAAAHALERADTDLKIAKRQAVVNAT